MICFGVLLLLYVAGLIFVIESNKAGEEAGEEAVSIESDTALRDEVYGQLNAHIGQIEDYLKANVQPGMKNLTAHKSKMSIPELYDGKVAIVVADKKKGSYVLNKDFSTASRISNEKLTAVEGGISQEDFAAAMSAGGTGNAEFMTADKGVVYIAYSTLEDYGWNVMIAAFADDIQEAEEPDEQAEEEVKEMNPYTPFWIVAAVLCFALIIFCLWPDVREIGRTFSGGDFRTRISFLIFGFGQICRGQLLQGITLLLLEAGLLYYFFGFGLGYIKNIGTLGTVARGYNEDGTISQGDNSFLILLFSLLTLFAVFLFILLWRLNVKENYKEQALVERGKKLPGVKGTWKSLFDENFDKLLLAFPVVGVFVFIVIPIVFMICVAFTNYDKEHQAPANLFTWVGLQNFKDMFSTSVGGYGPTFAKVLIWTLVWAFFATFLNYFLGMAVAILINRKGIKLKKLWRTILVMTIAIPQFVSLLYVYKMFAADGLVNNYLIKWGWIETYIPFWENPRLAQTMIIVINLWIGIPYLMLIATGLLMNIPEDLYESARIDGANSWQQFYKITLPYMLFVTGPYLLTSFIGNLNNFNVIFLLTRGKPQSMALTGNAGYTDLLVTWLYKMTVDDTNYRLAAVIGIMVFVITAVISLVVYGFLPSVKDEEGFQ